MDDYDQGSMVWKKITNAEAVVGVNVAQRELHGRRRSRKFNVKTMRFGLEMDICLGGERMYEG